MPCAVGRAPQDDPGRAEVHVSCGSRCEDHWRRRLCLLADRRFDTAPPTVTCLCALSKHTRVCAESYSMITMPMADSHVSRVLQEDNTDLAYEFARKFPGYTAEK